MIMRILFVLFLVEACAAQEPGGEDGGTIGVCDGVRAKLEKAFQRWPALKEDFGLNDKNLSRSRSYFTYDFAVLLDYPPGVGSCGGRYPIWEKEKKAKTSVVCIQTEEGICFKQFVIDSENCYGVIPTYRLQTDFDGSVFCFHPCTSSEMLPQMEERSNPYSAIGSVTDENLAKAWYSATEGMKMSDHAPPSGPACGAQNGLWSKMREGTSEYICLPFKDDTCKSMTTMKSMLCDGRRVYGIEKALWTSSYCFECRPDPIDLLFIQDVSSSVMKSVYDEMRLFIKYFVGDIDVSQDAHNVALMTFAKEPKIAFHLNTYNTKASIMSAIRSVNGTGGGTYLGKALELAASDIFTENNGDRGDSKNVVILLTDGRSKNTADVYKHVNALKGTAELFVVTSVISDMFADMPSSALSSNHVFTLSDTDGERFTRVILPDRFCNMAP